MMKIFKLLSFLGIAFLWLPSTSSAQPASRTVAPDLIIVDYKLGPFREIFVSDPGPAPFHGGQPDPLTTAQASVIRPSDRERPRYETKLKPEIKVRNTGTRIIKSTVCEFLLTTIGGPTNEVRAFTMRFSKVLRPGGSAKFSELIKAEHLETWRQRQKEGSMSVRASIIRIEYGDGTVWDRGPFRYP